MSHTPTPWMRAVRTGRMISGIVNGQWTPVAIVEPMPCVGGHDDLAAERGADMEEANAAFIVRAVNSHADLLAALDACLQYGSMTGDEWVTDQARSAIAKAKGEA